MFLHIVEAKPAHHYTVAVTFNNGESGLADLSDALRGPVFAPLRHQEQFNTLYVDPELATIAWPNGADLAPEYVYFCAFRDRSALQAQFKQWGYLAPSEMPAPAFAGVTLCAEMTKKVGI